MSRKYKNKLVESATIKFRKALEHGRQVRKQQPDKSGGVNLGSPLHFFWVVGGMGVDHQISMEVSIQTSKPPYPDLDSPS